MPVAVALIRRHQETLLLVVATRHHRAPTRLQRLAVLIPLPLALTRLLAAAMAEVAHLMLAVAELLMAAVAPRMAVVGDLTLIGNVSAFQKGPHLLQ